MATQYECRSCGKEQESARRDVERCLQCKREDPVVLTRCPDHPHVACTCEVCGGRRPVGELFYDPHGRAFQSYYCAHCRPHVIEEVTEYDQVVGWPIRTYQNVRRTYTGGKYWSQRIGDIFDNPSDARASFKSELQSWLREYVARKV